MQLTSESVTVCWPSDWNSTISSPGSWACLGSAQAREFGLASLHHQTSQSVYHTHIPIYLWLFLLNALMNTSVLPSCKDAEWDSKQYHASVSTRQLMDRHEAGTAGYIHKRWPLWGLPGGLVAESLPGNAADMAWIHGPGRPYIPQYKHACALQLLKPMLLRARGPQESSPHSLSLEEAPRQQWRPSTAKK